MLVFLIAAALCGFAGALALGWLFPLPAAVHAHLALAIGALPLIMGAMLHFAPVLTRSGAPAAPLRLLPWLAQSGGVIVTLAFVFPVFLVVGRNLAALLALVAAVSLAVWMWRRGRQALGKPHPGLNWYLAALVCLVFALASVLAMSAWPEHYLAWKRLHLHLNLIGLIGLTAIGTVQVLLPTAVGKPDAQVAGRLRSDLKYAFAATLLIAAGAAGFPWLGWAGLALWSFPLHRLLAAWLKRYRNEIFNRHGATPSLAVAPFGFALSLLFGALQGSGAMQGSGVILTGGVAHVFVFAFLLPLVTGAASQLLPIWLRPGAQTPWHGEMRRKLGRWGGIRALLFLGGGIAVAVGWRVGIASAALGLALFIAQLLAALTNSARIQVK
ncbi:MAG: hypothetical protein WC091_07810 [Sulfuricellaceae bacterium]